MYLPEPHSRSIMEFGHQFARIVAVLLIRGRLLSGSFWQSSNPQGLMLV
jgi:hypothetical protein